MFTSRLREWVRAQPFPLRAALVETWNTAGVRVGEAGGQPVVRLGRAAAILRSNGRVETTPFLRQDPCNTLLDEGVGEASWSSLGGAIFNQAPPTGEPSPLDGAGMHAAAGGWADIMGTLRLRLLLREGELGRLPWLENGPARSSGFGLPSPRSRRVLPSLAHELSLLLSEEFTTAAEDAASWWRGRLPVRLLQAMEAAGWNSPDRWNWLAASMNQPQPRRLQAVEAFPWASGMLRAPALLRVVDTGLPLAQAISASLGPQSRATPSLIRRLGGMPAIPGMVLADALHAVEQHGGTMPSTRSGWICWAAACAAARRAGQPAMDGGGWDALDAPRFLRAMADIDDVWRDLRTTLFRPMSLMLGTSAPRVGDMERACLWSSPAQSQERVQAWVADGGAMRRLLIREWPSADGYVSEDPPWMPLHETWDSGYGLHAVPLVTDAQLESESVAMDHCVRGYGQRCRLSGSHIVSWRTPDGQSIATQEISQDILLPLAGSRLEPFLPSRELPPATIQLKGYSNAQPPDKAFMAAWAHASAVATGTLALDCGMLAASLDARRSLGVGWDHIEWDHRAPGAARAALRLYSPMLPKRLREQLERSMRNHAILQAGPPHG